MRKVLLVLIKLVRFIGSLGFILGLFVLIFVGAPWYLYHDPMLPLWLKSTVYAFLGGLVVVLATVALEQGIKKYLHIIA